MDRGAWAAKTVKRPSSRRTAHPQYANYWAPLTRKRHIPPHPAQPRHTNDWAPRTRKRHQQEHRPQRPTERSDPTQHAKGRRGDCPGPRKGATPRRNVTRGGGGGGGSVVRALWRCESCPNQLVRDEGQGGRWPQGLFMPFAAALRPDGLFVLLDHVDCHWSNEHVSRLPHPSFGWGTGCAPKFCGRTF